MRLLCKMRVSQNNNNKQFQSGTRTRSRQHTEGRRSRHQCLKNNARGRASSCGCHARAVSARPTVSAGGTAPMHHALLSTQGMSRHGNNAMITETSSCSCQLTRGTKGSEPEYCCGQRMLLKQHASVCRVALTPGANPAAVLLQSCTQTCACSHGCRPVQLAVCATVARCSTCGQPTPTKVPSSGGRLTLRS